MIPVRHLGTLFTAVTTLLSIVAAVMLATAPSATRAQGPAHWPARLSETGLFIAGAPARLQPGVASFTPQYALWSDGADKKRWVSLPPGAQVDASDADAWRFPPGTRFWKEFSHAGRRIETRVIERGEDGRWRYAAYVWRADGSDADLAGPRGALLAVPEAPEGRYQVPGQGDCLACHEGAAVPVLGFTALQLSSRRDATALPSRPGDVDLPALAARGWLRGLPKALLAEPPRIEAASGTERAALGYLHANCGHCHNDSGAGAPVRLRLAQGAADAAAGRRDVYETAVDAVARYRPGGLSAPTARVIVPGRPDDSLLVQRMRSRHALTQMPPLGTQRPDADGLALVERWIADDLVAGAAPNPTPPTTTLALENTR